MRRLGLTLAMGAFTLLVAAFAATAGAGNGKAGFKTDVPAMLVGQAGWSAEAIISVGDTLGDGYTFEAIPDGISVERLNGQGTADILVNHELSPVPFPATRQDHLNSTVSRLRLHQKSGGVLRGDYVIPQSAGYQRFCSNFLVGAEHGFDRQLLFTNEEARDLVMRAEDSWEPGLTLGTPGVEQAGVVVAFDTKSGAFKTIYGMGRHNHENSVAVPGYGFPVVLSGDDTFDAPASQLYLYKADSGDDVWNDEGKLYAFVSNDPANNDYGDITVGETITGHFIEVPREIATGKDADDGSEITSADFGYPTPATAVPPTAAMPDGPQWVLEHWSNINNVFQFIRIEDTAYDRTNPRIMYMADTGEPRARPHTGTPNSTRLERGPTGWNGAYMNGRLYKFELGPDPLVGAKLSILPNANFDLNGYADADSPHQPDNMETTEDAIYFQEDPGSHNSSAPPRNAQGQLLYPDFPDATNARIWRYDLETGALQVVAEVNQSVPGSPTTVKGAWESSGIVDASAIFGEGAFLVDVQAHGWDQVIPGGNDPPAVPSRERGQLLLLRAPGS